jgi:4-amino-4-deoxy-L-arabinose transferase-like glycosyltransferase
LFYWVAALCTQWFGGTVAPHEAARIAIALFLYVTLGFLAATANALFGARRALIAVVLFIGSLGLFDKVHMLIADVSLISGLSIGLFGLATNERRPIAGGIALGIGAGVAFMSKGTIGLGILAVTAAVLLYFPTWRTPGRRKSFAIAAVVAAPAVLAWPIAVYITSPDLFNAWLWVNNLGRFFGFARLGESHGLWFYPLTLCWLSFPLWPFAIAACRAAWIGREPHDALLLPLIAFLVTMGILMFAWQSRAVYALPALLPLSLLAAAGLSHAPRWFVEGLQRCSLWLFPVAAGLLWLAWLAVGLELPWAVNRVTAREPGFVLPIEPLAVAIALAGSALWWLAARRRRITAENSVCVWAAGLTTFWLVLLTLWLPYLDYGNSYVTTAASLQPALPRDASCVASKGLGESQRAMFDYYAGLMTRRVESDPGARACRWLLVQRLAGKPHPLPSETNWREVWHGARPGDDRESFHLYRATDG